MHPFTKLYSRIRKFCTSTQEKNNRNLKNPRQHFETSKEKDTMHLNIFYNSPMPFLFSLHPQERKKCHIWKVTGCLSVFNRSTEEVVKAESCKNYHLLTPHWFGRILLCYVALWFPKEMVSEWLCSAEPGRQHGACSETFWASCIMLFVFPGKDGRVTGRTESLPESQMDYVHFLPVLI